MSFKGFIALVLLWLLSETAIENFISLLLFENVVLSHSHSHFPWKRQNCPQCMFLFAEEGHSNTARWACTAETLKEQHLLRAAGKALQGWGRSTSNTATTVGPIAGEQRSAAVSCLAAASLSKLVSEPHPPLYSHLHKLAPPQCWFETCCQVRRDPRWSKIIHHDPR